MRQSGIHSDLERLARFGANVSDSHSCFIFLPTRIAARFAELQPRTSQVNSQGTANDSTSVALVAAHSLSKEIVSHCVLARDAGLIGWVAHHGRAIHVSPFDRSSATLGVYTSNQELKSFIGVPVALDSTEDTPALCGVVACDSKKSFAFSKLQGKLLEELAEQVSCVIRRALTNLTPADDEELSWGSFLRAGNHFVNALGTESLQFLRVRTLNVPELEKALGIGGTLKLIAQVTRLIQQTIPPGTPVCRLANGDLLIAIDNMMVSFYESRFEALAGHSREQGHRVLLGYDRLPRGHAAGAHTSFESLVNQSVGVFALEPERMLNEYRRA